MVTMWRMLVLMVLKMECCIAQYFYSNVLTHTSGTSYSGDPPSGVGIMPLTNSFAQNFKFLFATEHGWSEVSTILANSFTSISYTTSSQGNPCSGCSYCTQVAIGYVTGTNYFISGFLWANLCWLYTTDVTKYDITISGGYDTRTKYESGGSRNIFSVEYISGSTVLIGEYLTLWDYSSMTAPHRTSAKSGTNFRLVKCISSAQCYATDDGGSNAVIYNINSGNFLGGQDAITSTTAISGQPCRGLSVFPAFNMYVVCGTTSCRFFDVANVNTFNSLTLSGCSNCVSAAGGTSAFWNGMAVTCASPAKLMFYNVTNTPNTVPAVLMTSTTIAGGPFVSTWLNFSNYYILSYGGDVNAYYYAIQNCDPSCATCNTAGASSCTSCYPGKYLTAGSCSPCTSPCTTCIGSATSCTGCIPGYYLSGLACLICDSTCLTCTSGGPTGCTSCTSGRTLIGASCPLCDPNCLTCNTLTTNCTSCSASPNPYLYASGTSSSCVDCTTQGRYISGMTCLNCNSNCLACVTTATTCTNCLAPNMLSSTNSTCTSVCTGAYFSNSTNPIRCFPCNSNCLTCVTTETTCLSCTAPAVLSGTNATCAACGNGYFTNGTAPIKCFPCNSNCVTCTGLETNCLTCSGGKFLNSYQSFPNSFCDTCLLQGQYVSGLNCLSCNPNCLACVTTSTTCTNCTAPSMLSSTNSSCVATCTGAYFSNSTNPVRCFPCNSNCLTCITTETTCTSCTAPAVLSGINATCAACGNGFFTNGTAPVQCFPCDPSCLTCSGTSTNCTSCTAPTYLNAYQNTPNGFCDTCLSGHQFISTSNCFSCDSNCSNCTGTSTNCTSCPSRYYLRTDNASMGTCEPCDDTCASCFKGGASGCLTCDPLLNNRFFLLVNSSCDLCTAPPVYQSASSCLYWPVVDVNLTLSNSASSDGLRSKIKVAIDAVLPANYTNSIALVFAKLLTFLPVDLTFFDANKNKLESPTPIVTYSLATVGNSTAELGAALQSKLASLDYNISYVSVGSIVFYVNQQPFRLNPFNYTFAFRNPEFQTGQVVAAKETGTAVAQLANMVPANNPTTVDLISTACVLDPSGTLTRFSQLIKIFNRIYYVNLNFGKVLNSFLAEIEQFSKTQTETYSKDYMMNSVLGYRGKMSLRSVVRDFVNVLTWKVGLYITSWILKLSSFVFIQGEAPVPRWLIKFIYFLPKIHTMLFNLVFVDFAFYGTHTALHFFVFPSNWIGYVFLLLFSLDIVEMCSVVISYYPWEHYHKLANKPSPQTSKPENQDNLGSEATQLHLNHSKSEQASSSQPDVKASQSLQVINYRATYNNIQLNHHLVDAMSNVLLLEIEVLKITGARIFLIMHIVKLTAYQMLVVVTQTLPFFAISILATLEFIKVTYSIYYQVKFRIFRSWIVFLMNVSQSTFLALFLVLGTYLHSKGSEMKEYNFILMQKVGIYFILISIATEYLLTLIHVVVTFYYMVKNRKKKSKSEIEAEKKQQPWYLVYKNIPIQSFSDKSNNLPDLKFKPFRKFKVKEPVKDKTAIGDSRLADTAPFPGPNLNQNKTLVQNEPSAILVKATNQIKITGIKRNPSIISNYDKKPLALGDKRGNNEPPKGVRIFKARNANRESIAFRKKPSEDVEVSTKNVLATLNMNPITSTKYSMNQSKEEIKSPLFMRNVSKFKGEFNPHSKGNNLQ